MVGTVLEFGLFLGVLVELQAVFPCLELLLWPTQALVVEAVGLVPSLQTIIQPQAPAPTAW